MANLFTCFLFFVAIFFTSPTISSSLKVDFYKKTCPTAEAIVRSTVYKAAVNDSGIYPALIRLHFHDCFVRGCDASILLDSTPKSPAEKEGAGNYGVQGFDVIDEAKAQLEAQCPNVVSCADIVAFAARDSVYKASVGRINYTVPGGRRDGTVSLASEVARNLPGAFFNASQLKSNFARKGLSLPEMVTLSGAHSIGDSHCSSFSKRLYWFNSNFSQDPSLNPVYANYLKKLCPPSVAAGNGTDPVVHFDPLTPTKLDNLYYEDLKSNKGLLFSDQVLWSSPLTRNLVKDNSNHPGMWAEKFGAAMVRMGSIEVLTGTQGEIRKTCRVVN